MMTADSNDLSILSVYKDIYRASRRNFPDHASPPAVSRILGVRSVRSFVREKHDISDFLTTFFGGWQAPRDRMTGFLRATRVSRKDPGEFWSVIPDVAHQGALDLGYIIENS